MLQLKNLRKKEGITQTQLSEYLGVTQATLSGWENEKFEIDTASLKKLASYFNVSVDCLLGIKTDEIISPSKSEELENVIIYSRNGETIRKKMTIEQLEAIHAIIQTMKVSDDDV